MLQIQSRLFDFDFGAGVFELLGDFFGFGLCNAFLDGLGSAFDEGFCVRKAEGSDCADFLNDRDFAAAPPATTATGAAALTPHLSSSSFTRAAMSKTERPLSHSIT